MGYFSELHSNMYMKSSTLDSGYPSKFGAPFESYVYIVTQTIVDDHNVYTINISAYTKEADAHAQRNYLERYNEDSQATYAVEQLDLNP